MKNVTSKKKPDICNVPRNYKLQNIFGNWSTLTVSLCNSKFYDNFGISSYYENYS